MVGIAGDNLIKADQNLFHHLLFFDTLRGTDSTGVATVNTFSGKTALYKEVGAPEQLYYTYRKDMPQGVPFWTNCVLMGHNRAATQGKVNAENAHPFEIGNTVGMHNGTVSRSSLKGFHEESKYEVDSQIILSHLDFTGSIQSVWDEADGAIALVWWDKVNKKLNFARNKQRPLFYVLSDDEKKLYWASEDWMLWAGCHRLKIKIGKIKEVRPDTHYIITITKQKVEVEEVALNPFTPKPIKTDGYGNWWRGNPNWAESYEEWWQENKGQEEKEKEDKGKVVDIDSKGGKHTSYGFRDAEFFIDSFTPGIIDGPSGQPRTGFFRGTIVNRTENGTTSFPSKTIKISCVHINDFAKRIIKRLEEEDEFGLYATSKAWWGWNQSEGRNILTVNFSEIELVEDYEEFVAAETIESWSGKQVNKVQYENLTIDGCAFCGCAILWEHRLQIKWIGYEECLCANCKERDDLPTKVA